MRASVRVAVLVPMLLGVAERAAAAPADRTVFTSFESINTAVGQEFSIGDPAIAARFGGDAFSGVLGIPELYFSGIHAWMIVPGGSASVRFESNASRVEFYARTGSTANGALNISARDDLGGVVGSAVLSPGAPFQLVSLVGDIDRIELMNLATGASHYASLDDFGYDVPEPPASLLLAVALALLAPRRRRFPI